MNPKMAAMVSQPYFLLFLVILKMASAQTSMTSLRAVDLTHALDENSIFWPGNPAFNFTILARQQNPGFWYESNAISSPEHIGTHLDAPAHFYKGGYRSQQVPMEKLVGPGVIVNVKDNVEADPDYRLTVQDLQKWESKHGRIPNGAIVLMNSGWSYKYANKSQYLGSNDTSNPATFHFPGFHEDAADWLVTYRQIHMIGVDTASMDYGQSSTYPVHVILGRENLCGVENVMNLDRLPENGTMIYVAAIKLFDGSGGPARVFATYYEANGNGETNAGHSSTTTAVLPMTTIFIMAYFV